MFGSTVTLLHLFCAPLAAAPVWSVDFEGTGGAAIDWMQVHGWKEVRGSAERWTVSDGALHLVQDDDSTTIGTERGFPIDPETAPRLVVRFRVDQWPHDADLSERDTEDSALRVFVVFDRGGGWFHPPHTLGYAFASSNTVGTFVTSDRFDNVKYLPVVNARDYDGGWIEIERDLVADYVAAFGERPPRIEAIALKADGNDTNARTRAAVDRIELFAR